MRIPKKGPLLAAGVVLLLAAGAAAQSIVYPKAESVEIRQTEAAGAPVVGEAQRGEALRVLSQSRFRFEVMRENGQRGFVPKLQVTDQPPAQGRRGVGGLLADDRSPEEMRTAAAGRGLSEEAESIARQEGITEEAIAMVRRMEQRAVAITDAQVVAFMREGGLKR